MRDKCEVCAGHQGGVLGNENVIDGVIVCDYCHATLLAFDQAKAKSAPPREQQKCEPQACVCANTKESKGGTLLICIDCGREYRRTRRGGRGWERIPPAPPSAERESVELPQGVKLIDDQRLREIMSGYADFPVPDYFETSSLAYEVRNWRMSAAPPSATRDALVGALRRIAERPSGHHDCDDYTRGYGQCKADMANIAEAALKQAGEKT